MIQFAIVGERRIELWLSLISIALSNNREKQGGDGILGGSQESWLERRCAGQTNRIFELLSLKWKTTEFEGSQSF